MAWFAIVDELIDGGNAVELDWKEALNEFVSRMKELADNNNLHIEAAWFDENEDIPVWCKDKAFVLGQLISTVIAM